MDAQDFINEAYLSIFVAVDKFDPNYKGANFHLYFTKVAKHNLASLVRDATREYGEVITFNEFTDELRFEYDSHHSLIEREIYEIIRKHPKEFNDQDVAYFYEYLDGEEIKDIAKRNNVSYQTIHSKIRRVKEKIYEIATRS